MLLLLLVGCTSLGTMGGARPVPVGEQAKAVAVTLQAGGDPLSEALSLPVPRIEWSLRKGVAPDWDVGLRLYPVGALVDVRYRFAGGDTWDAAVAPGVGGVMIPLSFTGRMGAIDVRFPAVIEVDLAEKNSVVMGPTVLFRQGITISSIEGLGWGAGGSFDAYSGGTLRWRVHGKRLVWGIGGELYGNVARPGPALWSAGLDVGTLP